MAVEIRTATPADAELLLRLIVALAIYEREPNAVSGTPELLEQALSASPPTAEALIAEVDGDPAGFALFHGQFSTWECRPGIWLEDLFVLPEHRRAGVGQALIQRLASLTLERGGTRLEWMVLDWNGPALSFYEQLGAEVLADWHVHRVGGERLSSLACGGVRE